MVVINMSFIQYKHDCVMNAYELYIINEIISMIYKYVTYIEQVDIVGLNFIINTELKLIHDMIYIRILNRFYILLQQLYHSSISYRSGPELKYC